MIRWLHRLFRREASPEAQQAAQALLLDLTPVDAWDKARGRRRKAVSRAEEDHWTAVMREIERQTGYEHGADVAARYEMAVEMEDVSRHSLKSIGGT